jgi:hypothetical protein
MSPNSPWNGKILCIKFVEKTKHTFDVQILFRGNLTLYETDRKSLVQPDRPQMSIMLSRIAVICMLDD